MTTPLPPQQADEFAHALDWDPPAALSSVSRWTCTRPECGAAVLRHHGGHLYGSALERRCPGAPDQAK